MHDIALANAVLNAPLSNAYHSWVKVCCYYSVESHGYKAQIKLNKQAPGK